MRGGLGEAARSLLLPGSLKSLIANPKALDRKRPLVAQEMLFGRSHKDRKCKARSAGTRMAQQGFLSGLSHSRKPDAIPAQKPKVQALFLQVTTVLGRKGTDQGAEAACKLDGLRWQHLVALTLVYTTAWISLGLCSLIYQLPSPAKPQPELLRKPPSAPWRWLPRHGEVLGQARHSLNVLVCK